MVQRAGRITCPRCGANNFDTITACWKCGTALAAGTAAGMPVSPASPVPSAAYPGERAAPMPQQSIAYTPAAPAVSAPSGDSGVAKRAAFALGITLPWLGLPIGWVFMMIEDSRKQAIGRICAVWSMIGLVLHLILLYFAMQQTTSFLLRLLPILEAATRSSQGAGGGEPNLPNGYPNGLPGGNHKF